MSFRKRSVGLTGPSSVSAPPKPSGSATHPITLGVRPSPLDGRPTTSTGTKTLDDILAGHAGLALGNSLLIGENGTTDFAGALLRYYAAEGVVQGHKVHVVGLGEHWGRELPGLVGEGVDAGKESEADVPVHKEKMKIAWRYERLGEFGARTTGPRATPTATPTPNRDPGPSSPGQPDSTIPRPFCHSFDLTKRLSLSNYGRISFTPVSLTAENPFPSILQSVTQDIDSSPPHTVHRLIIPTLLSPALFPPSASHPTHLLRFLHSLRALLRHHSTRLSAMLTLPLSLYPRSTGLVHWVEILCDGVLELTPFPYSVDIGPPLTTSSGSGKAEEKPQGMLKIHKLPVLTEKGGGGGGGDDLAFSLSRKRFVIKPFSLPPVEGDQEAQKGEAEGGHVEKGDIEF